MSKQECVNSNQPKRCEFQREYPKTLKHTMAIFEAIPYYFRSRNEVAIFQGLLFSQKTRNIRA